MHPIVWQFYKDRSLEEYLLQNFDKLENPKKAVLLSHMFTNKNYYVHKIWTLWRQMADYDREFRALVCNTNHKSFKFRDS